MSVNQIVTQTSCAGTGGAFNPYGPGGHQNKTCVQYGTGTPPTFQFCPNSETDGKNLCQDQGCFDNNNVCTELGSGGNWNPCPDGQWACARYDWPYDSTSASFCSKPDVTLCPDILDADNQQPQFPVGATGGRFITQNIEILDCANGNNSTPITSVQFNCIYPQNRFVHVQQYDYFVNQAFPGQATDEAKDAILINICGRPASQLGNMSDGTPYTSYCPTDPKTEEKMSDCAIMSLNDPDINNNLGYGHTCKNWCTQSSSGACDTAMTNTCNIKNTPDCACVTRQFDKDYEILVNSGLSLPAACWWIPCTGTQFEPYLVPSQEFTDRKSCQIGKLTICNDVIAAINSSGAQFNIKEDNVIDCGGSGIDIWKWIIIGVVIVVIIGILILIGYLVHKHSQKK